MLKASAPVPTRTARIQAAQKKTGIRSTARTVAAAMRLKCFALIAPLDSDLRAGTVRGSVVRALTLTPIRACVKGARSASRTLPASSGTKPR